MSRRPPKPHASPSARRPPAGARPAAWRGFTLIEIMIAVAIAAILAAVAFPAYFDSVRKSRRSDAFQAVSNIQQAQERWRSGRPAYASSLTAAAADDGLSLPAVSASGYYDLSVSDTSATGYTVVAAGKDNTSQAEDASCRRLGVRVAAGNFTYGGCGPGASCTLSYAASHPCWSR